MLPETIFDLASISKVIATAALTAHLVDRKWLDWATPVKAVFPDYPFGDIQVRHLLEHGADGAVLAERELAYSLAEMVMATPTYRPARGSP